jgi:hypothetical protein
MALFIRIHRHLLSTAIIVKYYYITERLVVMRRCFESRRDRRRWHERTDHEGRFFVVNKRSYGVCSTITLRGFKSDRDRLYCSPLPHQPDIPVIFLVSICRRSY